MTGDQTHCQKLIEKPKVCSNANQLRMRNPE